MSKNGVTTEKRLVIGITGPVGSGVSTVASTLKKDGFSHVSLSEPLKAELRANENLLPGSELNESTVRDFRRKLQDIGNKWRLESPERLIVEGLKTWDQSGDLVIEGIRNLREIDVIREKFANQFFLIAVHAPQSMRWERVRAHYGNNQGVFFRDDRRDSDEDGDFGQQVGKCMQQADYVISNADDHGSTDPREAHIRNFLKDDLLLMRNAGMSRAYTPPRSAHAEEVHMATAYAQSQMSRCLKRKVGAVIVDSDNLPLSLGYNENPVKMRPCVHEYQHCYKDEQMHGQLEKMQDVMCPACGAKVASLRKPWKCSSCGDDLKARFFPSRNMELCTAIHAEERAIRSLSGRSADGATIYSTTFPCFQCSRYIVDAGIKRVVYVEAYPVTQAEDFLTRNGVKVDPFQRFKARAFNLVFRQVD